MLDYAMHGSSIEIQSEQKYVHRDRRIVIAYISNATNLHFLSSKEDSNCVTNVLDIGRHLFQVAGSANNRYLYTCELFNNEKTP